MNKILAIACTMCFFLACDNTKTPEKVIEPEQSYEEVVNENTEVDNTKTKEVKPMVVDSTKVPTKVVKDTLPIVVKKGKEQ